MKVKKGRVEKSKKSKAKTFINVILLIIIFVCLGIIGKRLYDYRTNSKNKQHIDDIVMQTQEKVRKELGTTDPFEMKEAESIEILNRFKEENSDVVAYIEIPDTYVQYPILKGPDNDFYLRRGLDKEYDIAGSLFVDTMNNGNFNDDNTVVYGHHLEIDSMFTALDQYRKQDFAETHRTIYLTTEDGLREYQVFAAYGTPSDYDYRTINFGKPEDKIPYFEKLKNVSEVSLETSNFTTMDDIITLSTCQYDYDDQRLAVHAVRVR